MNEHSQTRVGKISNHGNGVGVPSPDMIEKRAREIAMIDERDPNEFTEGDWEQAHRELTGEHSENAPEETQENAEVVEEWDMVAADSGHRVRREGLEEEESVGEELVEEGIEEATHDQMVEARREELEEEGS